MLKERYYVVSANKGKHDVISFQKMENGMVNIHMGYSDAEFTAKECREIIEKLKQCIK